MTGFLKKKSSTPLTVFDGVAEGLKEIYKKKLLPLERESRFHEIQSPMMEDPDFEFLSSLLSSLLEPEMQQQLITGCTGQQLKIACNDQNHVSYQMDQIRLYFNREFVNLHF